jgi:Tol biopolymer transport system component
MADIARGTVDPFTSNEHEDQEPVWSPDGRLVYFSRHAGKSADLYVKDADGSTPERLVFSSADEKVPQDVTRDGRRLLVMRRDPTTGNDLWTISTTGDPDPRPVLRTPANEGSAARLSPDNRWFAYQSDEAGEADVFVRPFPSGPGKWKISSRGGNEPFWQSDGRRLFFSSGKKIMAVDVNPGPVFTAGIPREVLQSEGETDVLPGGKSFAALRKADEGPGAIEAVVNWTALLEKK